MHVEVLCNFDNLTCGITTFTWSVSAPERDRGTLIWHTRLYNEVRHVFLFQSECTKRRDVCNVGKCVPDFGNDSYTCQCPIHYNGQHCERECSMLPCNFLFVCLVNSHTRALLRIKLFNFMFS